ncbi:TfoX/Sxy family protein [Aquirhabdus parva]|uniref:Transcriptional regulator n=1 Tax=Aquirhabdus parva TaxID=2283318 RepID=A0A345P3M0_9GAMM|nr:TfoX/Sxy family protein [Aquirhabdus parva]AXI01879.1 transcriptional regulator [Aquirhabdus parva]
MATEFTDFLHEVFAQFGVIRIRRMFGGYGVYYHDLMFGLVADEILYLKADAASRQTFEKLGLPPFKFDREGKAIQMSYYQAPDEIFEDFEQAAQWARLAYAAATRAQKPKK